MFRSNEREGDKVLIHLFVTLWTVADQAPLSGILQARILGLPCPLSGRLLDRDQTQVIYVSAFSGSFFTSGATWGGDAIWIFNFDILVKDREAEFSGSPDEGTWRGCSGSGREK